jgi:uncharacterized membrane protein
MELTALKGILPTRLAWISGIGAILIVLASLLGMPRWFLPVIGVVPTILVIMLLVQVIAKGHK